MFMINFGKTFNRSKNAKNVSQDAFRCLLSMLLK